jgi:hypothetical protein
MVTAPPQMSSPLTGSVDLSRINSIRLAATTRQTYDAALKFVPFLKIADVENLLPLSDNPRSYQI